MRVQRTSRIIPALQATCIMILLLLPLPGMADIERVRVGIHDNPPKVFMDDNGRASGFWPDLTRAIAEREGWKVEWVHGTWAESLERGCSCRVNPARFHPGSGRTMSTFFTE